MHMTMGIIMVAQRIQMAQLQIGKVNTLLFGKKKKGTGKYIWIFGIRLPINQDYVNSIYCKPKLNTFYHPDDLP